MAALSPALLCLHLGSPPDPCSKLSGPAEGCASHPAFCCSGSRAVDPPVHPPVHPLVRVPMHLPCASSSLCFCLAGGRQLPADSWMQHRALVCGTGCRFFPLQCPAMLPDKSTIPCAEAEWSSCSESSVAGSSAPKRCNTAGVGVALGRLCKSSHAGDAGLLLHPSITDITSIFPSACGKEGR